MRRKRKKKQNSSWKRRNEDEITRGKSTVVSNREVKAVRVSEQASSSKEAKEGQVSW